MTIIGPRSGSSLRETNRLATRSGRLSDSLSIVPANRDVLTVGAHHETPLRKNVERFLSYADRHLNLGGEIVRVDLAETVGRIPRASLVVAQHAHELDAVFLLERQREPMSLEHSFDRVPVMFADAAEQKVCVVR